MFALPREDTLGVIFGLTCLSIAICAMYSSLKVFGQDREIYEKEVESGINKLSYYLGKLTAYTPSNLFLPLVYITVWYTIIIPRAGFFPYFGMFLLLQFTWSAYGNMMSILLHRNHAAFYSILGILFSTVLCGFEPTLSVLYTKWYAAAIVSLSPLRYAFEGMYLVEIQIYQSDNVSVDSALAYYGFQFSDLAACMIMQVVFGILFYIIGFIGLYFQDPRITDSIKYYSRSWWRKGTSGILKGLRIKKTEKKEENSLNQALLEEEDDEDFEEPTEDTLKETQELELQETQETLRKSLLSEEQPIIEKETTDEITFEEKERSGSLIEINKEPK